MKHLRLLTCAIMALMSISLLAETTLFFTDFSSSEWAGHETICEGETIEETVNGIYFRCDNNSKYYSIADGVLTFCDNNAGNKYFMAIPVQNVNKSLKVTITTAEKSQRVNFLFRETNEIEAKNVSTSSSPSNSKVDYITLEYEMTGDGTDALVILGRQGSGQKSVIKTITITTPGGDEPQQPDDNCSPTLLIGGTNGWAGGGNYTVGETATPLTIEAQASKGGALTYQWKQYAVGDVPANAQPADGATNSPSFTPSTTTPHGEYIYFCVVSEEGCANSVETAPTGAFQVVEGGDEDDPTITIDVIFIREDSAVITLTPSNEEIGYFFDIVDKDKVNGMTDTEIAQQILSKYSNPWDAFGHYALGIQSKGQNMTEYFEKYKGRTFALYVFYYELDGTYTLLYPNSIAKYEYSVPGDPEEHGEPIADWVNSIGTFTKYGSAEPKDGDMFFKNSYKLENNTYHYFEVKPKDGYDGFVAFDTIVYTDYVTSQEAEAHLILMNPNQKDIIYEADANATTEKTTHKIVLTQEMLPNKVATIHIGSVGESYHMSDFKVYPYGDRGGELCTPFVLTAKADNPEMGSVSILEQASCENGNTAIVIAEANEGYEFVKWSDESNETTHNVTLTADLELTAYFQAKAIDPDPQPVLDFDIVFKSSGTGSDSNAGITDVQISDIIESGAELLSSVEVADKVYLGATGLKLGNSSTGGKVTLTLASETTINNIVLLAKPFGTDAPSITINGVEVAISDSATYNFDLGGQTISQITISTTGSKQRVYILALNLNGESIPIEPCTDQFTLTVKSADEAMGTATILQNPSCENNQTGKVKAEVNEGYEFVKWSDENKDIEHTVTLTADLELTAYFQIKSETPPQPGGEYDITFKDNDKETDGSSQITEIENIIESGGNLISSLSDVSYIYNGRDGRGIKLGKSGTPGSLTINLATSTALTSIDAYAMAYNDNETQITINNQTFDLTKEVIKYTIDCGGANISKIEISTPNGRAYIIGLNLNSGEIIEPCTNPFNLTAEANDPLLGSVEITQAPSCENDNKATLLATANANAEFVRWSNGYDVAYYSLILTKDTVITAIFQSTGTPCETTYGELTESAEGSYTWFGDTYTESGNYQHTIQNVAGCDSIITLHLTITEPVIPCETTYGEITETAEGSYTWFGDTYTESGNYQHTIQNVAGCDSVITLHLTITEPVIPCETTYGEITETAEGSYTWFGDTYTESGNYQHTIQNVAGCDSIITLHLTITPKEEPCTPYTLNIENSNADAGIATVIDAPSCLNNNTAMVYAESFDESLYTFAGWSDGSTETTHTIQLTTDMTLTAYWTSHEEPCTPFTIKANNSNPDAGSIEIVQEPTCENQNTVIIRATANEGYEFTGWTDGNTEALRTITLTDNSIITATWKEIITCVDFILNLQSNNTAQGSVSIIQAPSCENGQIAVFSATAADNYKFNQWSDGNTQNPRTMTLSEDMTLYALFSINQYSVLATSTDASAGSVTGSGTYDYNTQVTLIASPSAGYTFSSWEDGNTDNPRIITVVSDTIMRAVFNEAFYTITAVANDTALGYTIGSGEYKSYTFATLTAVPYDGYTFLQWSDGVKSETRRVLVLEDATYTAIFTTPKTYHIQVISSNSEMGSVSGGGDYRKGEEAVLTATAKPGYTFIRWHDNNTDNPRTLTVTRDATYKAYFWIITDLENNTLQGVSVEDMNIHIDGYENETMNIYTSTGQTIYTGKVRNSITMPYHGMYLITINNCSAKVIL